MSKVQINNEIILLRGSVEQARVQLIAKLARDAFKLRKKKGTEQQKAKNVRKADKIAAEILAIKKVKKDEITKYILSNPLNLDEILKDQKAEPLTRIMARIANHKKFSQKIAEFKSKYPNYAEFLGPGRRKKAISEWKENKKSRKAQKEENDESSKNASDAEASENNDESSDNGSEANDDDEVSEGEEVSSDVVEEKESEDSAEEKVTTAKTAKVKKSKKIDKENAESTNVVKGKKNKKLEVKDIVEQEKESDDSEEEDVKSNIVESESVQNGTVKKEKPKNSLGKRKKANKEEKQSTDKDTKPEVKKKKSDTAKVISKQAIVKKFTDILKEEESKPEMKPEINFDSERSNLKIEKEVDSFFFSGDGGENYLSVALPKNNSHEDEEEYGNDRFNKKHFSRQQNDKFFSKVNKFQNNGPNNYNSNRQDSRWEGQRDNERPYSRDKPGFNKFNSRSNDRFNDRPNNRFNGKPNDRFNDRPNNKFKDRPNNKFGNDRNDKPFKKHGQDSFESKSNEVLHPSWEAKKKQQDILKKGFQGKKIVFGDDV
ncbi:hypothetical protein TSAR_014724 [Trichomalopsis sarcophagae]|uniref:Serum response factor-binding protein 1 n=1 Tax=Trichomalopsis sarcophagae TaxID=543379 RepID=A0A232FF48_9HYME|nr:hypothetical protein TSAR_014724 [Trichomalopsis sarcophagae]